MMASSDKDKTVNADLYDLLMKTTTCPVCKMQFKDPKTLHCGHSFCSSCIEHVFHKSPSKNCAPCPLCRKQFFPEGQAVANIPRNQKLQEILEVLDNYQYKQTQSHSVCGLCESECETVEYVCVQHLLKMCRACTDKHNKLDKYQTCNVILLSKVQGTALTEIINDTEKSDKCPVHHEEDVDKYCETCSRLVCRICTVDNCSSHSVESIEQTAASCKEKLKVNIDENKPKISQLENHLVMIESCRKQLVSTANDAQAKIKDVSNHFRGWIDEEEDRCLRLVKEINHMKMKEIDNLKETLDIQLVKLTSLHEHMTSLHEHMTSLRDFGSSLLVTKRYSFIKSQWNDLEGSLQDDYDVPKEAEFSITFSTDKHMSNTKRLQLGTVLFTDSQKANISSACNMPNLDFPLWKGTIHNPFHRNYK